MKRLIKKAKLFTFYHGTSAYVYNKNILNEGLKNPYLTNKRSSAEYFADEKKSTGYGYPIILVIEISEEELNKLGKISADYNAEYVKNESSPDGFKVNNWTESLEQLNAIRLYGTIPPQYITRAENLDGSKYIFDEKHIDEKYNHDDEDKWYEY